MTKEQKFYKALQDLFIGAKIEGEGGFVNLMRIKANYYRKIEELLKKDIEKALQKYPNFRDELFDKLYSFFNRYFTKSGSIYFNQTPFSYSIYEKIYTDEKDVILFWKTQMLYYVKSDRIFKNLEVSFDNYKFFFDVSKLEHKRANEKRSLIYQFKDIRKDGAIVFEVFYSEKGKITKIDEIQKELKKKGIKIKDEDLERAFNTFEKQSEVDYFINKNAKEFLKEQFKLWLYQYVYSEESEWPKERIDQLQILKDIAYRIIDFIAQFEDELVKIWNKPKFVRNSNYVITLDRIKNLNLIEKILKHKGIEAQIKEWQDLGIVDKDFKVKEIITFDLIGKHLSEKYKHLPIDTKYFKDLELEILSCFENLDQALDGWLIKSENYQALNTILPKFKEKVQTIYIDPPFNKEQEADYFYSVKYKDATWASILENRLELAKDLLNEKGSIFVRCDYNGNWIVRPLMNEIFGKENFRNEIDVSRVSKQDPKVKRFNTATDSLFFYSKTDKFIFNLLFKRLIKAKEERWHAMDSQGQGQALYIFGYKFQPPEGRHWTYGQEKIEQLEKEGRIRIKCRKCDYIHITGKWKGCPKCKNREDIRIEYLLEPTEKKQIDSNWTDIPGYTSNWEFQTENSEILLKRVIESTSNEGDLVIDFFLGSGTTCAVAHKLKRKWLGIEMGEHFYSVVLPRMKKVLAYDKSGISKEKDVKEKYNENKAGGFFKYYELEQYEDTLRKVKYEDSTLFEVPGESPYSQYIFMKDKKLLDALKIDYQNNKVKVDLSKLYPDIDTAETISNLKGKWIKRITEDGVELVEAKLTERGLEFDYKNIEKIDIKNLDWKIIKNLIWW